MEQPCVKLPAPSLLPLMEGWLPAGPTLIDAWTWSTTRSTPTIAGQRVQGGKSSHHSGCPLLIPQLLSTLWMRRIWHTQRSGQGWGPNLAASAPDVPVQALDNSSIFFFFSVVFSPKVPINRKLSLASAVEITLR